MRRSLGRGVVAWSAAASLLLAGMPMAWAECADDQVQVGEVCVLASEVTRVTSSAQCRQTSLEACREACELRDAVSCRELATATALGRGGVPRDYEAATRLFERACNLGDRESCLVLRPLYTDPADASEVDTGRLGRISLEALAGIAGAGIAIGLTFLIGANSGGDEDSLIGTSMSLGALAMAASVWGTGEALDGDGSFLLTLLGAGVGFGIASMLTFAADDDVATPFIWTLAVLPITGTIVGYELSSSSGYGVLFPDRDRKPVAAQAPTLLGSVGTVPGDPSVVVGVAGTF